MKKYIQPSIKVATIKTPTILAGSDEPRLKVNSSASEVNEMDSKRSIFDYE